MVKNHKILAFFTSHRLWVFLSQLVGMLVAIIFGKLIAVYIEPEIFGQYSLILGFEAFFAAMFVHPVNQSFQYVLQTEKKSIVSSYYFKLFFRLTVFSVVFYVFLSFFGFFHWHIILILLAITFFSSHFKIFSGLLGLEFQFKAYSLLQILNRLLLLLLFVLFAIGFGYASVEFLLLIFAASFFLSFLVQMLIVGDDFLKSLREKVSVEKKKGLRKELFDYTKPLIILAGFSWVSNYADKYLIDFYLDTKEVGYYAAGYSLGTKFFLSFVSPFLMLLKADIYKLRKDKKTVASGVDVTIKHLLPFLGISIGVVLILIFEYDFLGGLFLSAAYSPSFVVIPVIAGAFLMLTASYFLNTSFLAWNKPNYVLYANVSGAVINIILNIIMIPMFGIIGAAFATLISYTLQLVVSAVLYFRFVGISRLFA